MFRDRRNVSARKVGEVAHAALALRQLLYEQEACGMGQSLDDSRLGFKTRFLDGLQFHLWQYRQQLP